MEFQKWLCLFAQFFLTYFWRSRWCDLLSNCALELLNLRKKVNTLSVSLNIFYVFPSSECLSHPTFIGFRDLNCSEMLFSGIDLQIGAKNGSNFELIM